MARFIILSIAVSFGCLASFLTSQYSVASFSFTKSALISLLLYLPLSLIWGVFLYPLYFSPLLKLPQAPQSSSFFNPPNGDDILEFMDSTPNDGMIRFLDFLNGEVICLTQPKIISEFLQTKSDHYIKNPKIKRFMETFLGNGLVTAEGSEHKRQRKALSPAFNFRVVKDLYPLFWSKASEMVALIKAGLNARPNTSVVNIDDLVGRASLDIIGLAGFGSKFDSLSNPHGPLNVSYRRAFLPNENSRIIFILTLLTHPMLVNLLPMKETRGVVDGVWSVTKFVRDLIDDRKRDMYAHIDDMDYFEKSGQKDIISMTMKTGAFDTEGLVNQSKTLLAAGHETSATAMTWGVYLLSQPRYVHIQQRLREEIRAHLPSPESGIPVNADMLDKLPYLDAVSKEIMRVYAPVPTVGRIATRDTELGGVQIPKGTSVRVHPWAINKAKHLWGDDAREFNPERWLVGEHHGTGGAESLAYVTFGHGPRGCIGKGFAQAENKALLSALIGSFELKPVGGRTEDIKINFGITAKILRGLKVEATVIDGW